MNTVRKCDSLFDRENKIVNWTRSFKAYYIENFLRKSGIAAVLEKHENGYEIQALASELQYNNEALTRLLYVAQFLNLLMIKDGGIVQLSPNPILYNDVPSSTITKIVFHFLNGKLHKHEIVQFETQFTNEELDFAQDMGILNVQGNTITITNEYKEFFMPQSTFFVGPRLAYQNGILRSLYQEEALQATLSTGKNQWYLLSSIEEIHDPFQFYLERPELLEDIMRGMHRANKENIHDLVKSIDWSKINSVLDIGGASGALADEIISFSPSTLHVEVYERKEAQTVLQKIRREINSKDDERVDKITYHWGNFLTTSQGLYGLDLQKNKYDLIFLSWVLHDWNDETSIEILTRAKQHLNHQAHIIIVEGIMPDDYNHPLALAHFEMFLLSDGGRERTMKEWKYLAEQAGLRIVETKKLSGLRDMIRLEIN